MTDTLSLNTNPEAPVSPANVLRIRNFRLLWIGEGISLLGDQFHMIALPWLVLSLTGNPLAVGIVFAMAGIPRALFMLVGGALTDRFSPRNLMISSNLGRMILTGLLAVLLLVNKYDKLKYANTAEWIYTASWRRGRCSPSGV